MPQAGQRDQDANRRLCRPASTAWLGLVGLAVAVIAAGCGSSRSSQTATGGAASTSATARVVVSTSQSAAHGTILVSGDTLYTLKPSQTACTSACLKVWPELLLPKGVATATAGPGVNASKLGTLARAGGALQVTYSGQALYYFAGDAAAGQVNGNVTDTWGTWSDVVTAGQPAASTPTTAPASGGAGF
jgi:predicted lipoprotein with Yx(FWY)xxD motif